MTMTHELRKLAEAATPGPWLYRPDNIDDWGWVRTSHEEDGFKPLVAEALRGSMKDNSDFDEHRRNKTDPYYHNAAYIAAANPKTILELLDRIAELEGALKPFAEAAKNFDRFPIKDATEWFAYGGESGRDAVRRGAISVTNLRRAAELVKP